MDGTMLRLANVASENDIEAVRDVLDGLGTPYEHVESDPEDSYPQTAYFQVSSSLDDGPLVELADERGLDIELL